MTTQEKHLELKELEMHIDLLKISMALQNMDGEASRAVIETFKGLLSLSSNSPVLDPKIQEI